MMPRRSVTRKSRPRLEALETKQLLSAGPPTGCLQILLQAPAPLSSRAECGPLQPCGTGTSIRIITS
jgi:hypothetical protein